MWFVYAILGSITIVTLITWVIGLASNWKNKERLGKWVFFPYYFVLGLVISIIQILMYLGGMLGAVLVIVLSFLMNVFYLGLVSYNPMTEGRRLKHYAMAARNISIKKDIEDTVRKTEEAYQYELDRRQAISNQYKAQAKHWEKQAKSIRQKYYTFNQEVQGAVVNDVTFKKLKGNLKNHTVPVVQGHGQQGQQENKK